MTIDPETDLAMSHLIGSGRHGTVFLAACRTKPGRPGFDVAVKIPAMGETLPSAEIEALARFRHPNVVKFLAGPTKEGAIVLEHCSRGTLADLVAEQRSLPAHEVADLLRGVIAALRTVHAGGWIHGDVTPANIGIRADHSPVLLDFATARRADGDDVTEGTLEFAGPNREAVVGLDTRSLAASALWAMGPANRWERDDHDLRPALVNIIDRLDSGHDVALAELDDLFDFAAPSPGLRSTDPLVEASQRAAVPNPITRSFGKQPPGQPTIMAASKNGRRFAVAALALTATLLIGIEVGTEQGSASSAASRKTKNVSEASLPASLTLTEKNLSWDGSTGTLVRHGQHELRWRVGRPGDMAAVADWNCDGEPTLGVYRPSTGSWFVFDTWKSEALSSSSEQLAEGGRRLSVSVEAHGCARPIISSHSEI